MTCGQPGTTGTLVPEHARGRQRGALGGPPVRHYTAFVRDPDGNNVEATYQDWDFAGLAQA